MSYWVKFITNDISFMGGATAMAAMVVTILGALWPLMAWAVALLHYAV